MAKPQIAKNLIHGKLVFFFLSHFFTKYENIIQQYPTTYFFCHTISMCEISFLFGGKQTNNFCWEIHPRILTKFQKFKFPKMENVIKFKKFVKIYVPKFCACLGIHNQPRSKANFIFVLLEFDRNFE